MTCKNCGPKPCDSPVTAGPKPYYEQVSQEVTQDHTSRVEYLKYVAGIEITDDWVIPEDNGVVTVHIPNIYNVPVGAYLNHRLYGTFQIAYFNPEDSSVGLKNELIPGTATAGTFVKAGELFILTPRPCCEEDTSTLFPYLAVNFIAPEVSQSLTIDVTSTFGLRIGDLIRISNGVYRLSTISSSKQIVILNEGAGVTPGTTVTAKNASGEFQYLLTSETASACSSPTTIEGRISVCDGAVQKILTGDVIGQVPVLQQTAGGVVEFQLLDADVRVCTTLTQTLNITSAQSNYVITVESTNGFTIGDTIQIDFGSVRFLITSIGSTTINISSTPGVPGITATALAGAYVCKTLTTELLKDQLTGAGTGLQSQITGLRTDLDAERFVDRPASVSGAIATEVTNRNSAITTAVNNEATARNSAISGAISSEVAARNTAIGTAIATEVTDRNTAITNSANTEIGIRAAADTGLSNSISNIGVGQTAAGVDNASGANLTVNGTSVVSSRADLVFTNPSNRNMVGIFTLNANFECGINTSGTTRTRVQYSVISQILTNLIGQTTLTAWGAGGTVIGRGHVQTHEYTASGVFLQGGEVVCMRSFVIAPGQEVRIRAEASTILSDIGAANQLEVAAGSVSLNIDAIQAHA